MHSAQELLTRYTALEVAGNRARGPSGLSVKENSSMQLGFVGLGKIGLNTRHQFGGHAFKKAQ